MKVVRFSHYLLLGLLFLTGCQNKKRPNYQLFPDMYEPIGYEAYQESAAFSR